MSEVGQEKVLWKTTAGDLTAKEIIEDLQNNGELNKVYVTELMRISRDILMRRT